MIGCRRARWAVTAVAASALLASCSGDEEPVPDGEGTSAAPSAADRLAQAQDVLVDAGSVRLTMEGADLPEDRPAYIIGASGSGTTTPPAFSGTITARVAGVQADVPTIAVEGSLYVQLPFSPGYVETDPDDLNVPDPARLFDPEVGLVTLLTDTADPAFGEQSRAGAEIVQEVSGTVPGQTVVDLLYAGDPDEQFDVVYGLVEESWEVRTVSITGPFYPPAVSSYSLTLDEYGVPVTIEAP